MSDNKKIKFLSIYAVLITILFVLILVALIVVRNTKPANDIVGAKPAVIDEFGEIDWAVRGWNNTMQKLDYDADIVFFGDSITAVSDFRRYYPNKKIVNLGYPGDGLVGMLDRVSGVISVKPEKIFILGGINGLNNDNIEESIETYKNILDQLKYGLPSADIYVQSVLPISKESESDICSNTTIRDFNKRLEQLADEYGLDYIDLYSEYDVNGYMNPELTIDGLHIWPDAYDRWAEKLKSYID